MIEVEQADNMYIGVDEGPVVSFGDLVKVNSSEKWINLSDGNINTYNWLIECLVE